MLEALGWISPEMKELVMTVDRFETTYGEGFNHIKKQLENFVSLKKL